VGDEFLLHESEFILLRHGSECSVHAPPVMLSSHIGDLSRRPPRLRIA
jgi:hypothetical protein